MLNHYLPFFFIFGHWIWIIIYLIFYVLFGGKFSLFEGIIWTDLIRTVSNSAFFNELQSNSSVTSRKPLQSDNTMHSKEEDSISITSSYPLHLNGYRWIVFLPLCILLFLSCI